MRFFISVLIFVVGFFSFPEIGHAEKELHVSAENAILIDAATGKVLFQKRAHEQTDIASITKIMTALVALREGNLDDEVRVSRNAAFTSGSSIYLETNEKMTLKDLLYGLMLRSGNDAAVAIAEHIGGSEVGFSYLMNETAAYIGMTNSHFMNAHGLNEEQHYSTAYDMALLMRHAMDNENFQKISGERSHKAETKAYPWKNKNKLLTSLYEACTGGKTGYTKTAGRTLVTTAEKDGLSLIAVTLDAPDDWNDHIHMYESAFEEHQLKQAHQTSKNDLPITQKEEVTNQNDYRHLNIQRVSEKSPKAFQRQFKENMQQILRMDGHG